MAGFVVLGALAAFGLMCAVWTLWGFCLRPDRGMLIYRGPEPLEFARRYLWLREMGLLRCPLVVADPPESCRDWLRGQGIGILCENDPDLDRRENT